MAAETHQLITGHVLLLVLRQRRSMTLHELIDPPEMTYRAFPGGILGQITRGLRITGEGGHQHQQGGQIY